MSFGHWKGPAATATTRISSTLSSLVPSLARSTWIASLLWSCLAPVSAYRSYSILRPQLRALSTLRAKITLHRTPLLPTRRMSAAAATAPLNDAEKVVLNRDSFTRTIDLVAFRIPAKLCSVYLIQFKDFLFERPRFKRIYDSPDGDAGYRLLLLREDIKSAEQLQESLPKELLAQHLEQCSAASGHPCTLQSTTVHYALTLTYEHISADEVLHSLLHGRVAEVPTAFEQAGHIAHMNLRDDCVPFKHLIGQVVLDKNPNIQTVVNKVGQIETEFRTFPLEVIAGKDDLEVTLKESGANFSFNFAQVYWNSRLQMEHNRIIKLIRDSAVIVTEPADRSDDKAAVVVADLMSGVGPFAVPLAMTNSSTFIGEEERNQGQGAKKKGKQQTEGSDDNKIATLPVKRKPIKVYANDLNPASFKYLVINTKNNRCGKFLYPHNEDGRKFLIDLVEDRGVLPHEAIMNLPQNATDFLDVFVGLQKRFQRFVEKEVAAGRTEASSRTFFPPRIHVYAFSTHPEDPIQDIVERSAGMLRCSASDMRSSGSCEGHIVRDVAPKKVMVCLSFVLPEVVCQAEPLSAFGAFSFLNKKRGTDQLRSEEEELELHAQKK